MLTPNVYMCAIRIKGPDLDLLLFCLYMPCDTEYSVSNLNEYNSILQEISDIRVLLDVSQIIVGGDFNTDFSRSRSLHTTSLRTFLERENMQRVHYSDNDIAPYTYESKITSGKYILLYICNWNFFSSIVKHENIYSGDNLSDHVPVSLCLNSNISSLTVYEYWEQIIVDGIAG